jgi:hypothetical protein
MADLILRRPAGGFLPRIAILGVANMLEDSIVMTILMILQLQIQVRYHLSEWELAKGLEQIRRRR